MLLKALVTRDHPGTYSYKHRQKQSVNCIQFSGINLSLLGFLCVQFSQNTHKRTDFLLNLTDNLLLCRI